MSRNTIIVPLNIRSKQQQPAVTRQRPVPIVAHATMVCHAIAKQQPHCNRGTAFSTRSVPRCYKVAVRGLLRFSRCKLLLLEAGS
jgi:hypothetical protein